MTLNARLRRVTLSPAFVREWTRDRGMLLVLAFGAYTVAFWLWQVFRWGGADLKVLIGDLAPLPGALIAAIAAWRAGSHPNLAAKTRRGWRLVSLAYLVYWAGDMLWAYYQQVLKIEPFPSAADAGYLLFYPVLLLALLAFPVSRRDRDEPVKFWLDAATVLLGGWMIVWHFVLGPTAMAAGADPLVTTLSVAYPLGDLVMLFGILVIVLRRPAEGSRVALAILTGGLFLYFIADLGYGYLSLLERYESGDWPDALWMGAYFLTVLSAQYQYARASRGAEQEPTTVCDRQYSLLPYAAVVIGDVLLIIAARHRAIFLLNGLIFGAVGITGLVMAREIAVIQENLRLMADFQSLAVTDGLTGTTNRRHFFEIASARLARAQPGTISVLVVDIDDFKDINDHLGHEAGDQALVAVSDRLRACVRPSDVVARIGGDEFVVLLEGPRDAVEAAGVAERMVKALGRPLVVREREVTVRASLGVAHASAGDDITELIRKADVAMYTAKRSGKAHFEVYVPRMEEDMLARIERGLGSHAHRSIRGGQPAGGLSS